MEIAPGGRTHRDRLARHVRRDPPLLAPLALLVAQPHLPAEVDHGCKRGVAVVEAELVLVEIIAGSGHYESGIERGVGFDEVGK